MADHGTRTAYVHDQCRCDPCRKANAKYAQELRSRLYGTEPPDHNASSYTNYGCRCKICRDDHNAVGRAYYHATKDGDLE